MQTFTASDGETIHVAVSGAGPPVVLLHEWASNHRVWRGVVERLAADFTLYRWDARGHAGRRSTGHEAATVGRMARDLGEMLDHFSLRRPLIAGHSMGALTAWDYIGRYGCRRLSRLCVLDQSPRLITDDAWKWGIYYDWPSQRNRRFLAEARADFVETVLRLIAEGRNAAARHRYENGDDSFARMRAYLALLEPAPLLRIWESLTDADWRPVLPRIRVPTLLVYGSASNYYGAECGEYVARHIPESRLEVYDGADHSPHLTEPDRFATDLRAFAREPVGE